MIRNKNKFNTWLPAMFDGEFDWDFLTPAFKGTKIQPMDFDAVIERKRHRLIIETKDDCVPIPIGQQITLHNEWRLGATIIHLSGKSPENINGYAIYKGGEYDSNVKIGSKLIKPATWDDVLYVVRCWFCMAENIPRPTRDQWDNELFKWDYERGLKKYHGGTG